METIFKVAMNAGPITLTNFEQFYTEARRLGISFEDRNWFYDENPEVPGIMAMLLTYGGNKLYFIYNLYNKNDFYHILALLKNQSVV